MDGGAARLEQEAVAAACQPVLAASLPAPAGRVCRGGRPSPQPPPYRCPQCQAFPIWPSFRPLFLSLPSLAMPPDVLCSTTREVCLSFRAQDTADGLQNVSRTIEDLLDGYDIRLRPQFGGGSSFNSISTPRTPMQSLIKTHHCLPIYLSTHPSCLLSLKTARCLVVFFFPIPHPLPST